MLIATTEKLTVLAKMDTLMIILNVKNVITNVPLALTLLVVILVLTVQEILMIHVIVNLGTITMVLMLVVRLANILVKNVVINQLVPVVQII